LESYWPNVDILEFQIINSSNELLGSSIIPLCLFLSTEMNSISSFKVLKSETSSIVGSPAKFSFPKLQLVCNFEKLNAEDTFHKNIVNTDLKLNLVDDLATNEFTPAEEIVAISPIELKIDREIELNTSIDPVINDEKLNIRSSDPEQENEKLSSLLKETKVKLFNPSKSKNGDLNICIHGFICKKNIDSKFLLPEMYMVEVSLFPENLKKVTSMSKPSFVSFNDIGATIEWNKGINFILTNAVDQVLLFYCYFYLNNCICF
jgi:hypothetical protein